MNRRVVVVSLDGLSSVDLAQLESLSSFKYLLDQGSVSRDLRGIYPTQTYPLHASMITGCYPSRHGISTNTLFQPGRVTPDWHWYRKFLRVPPLYDLATKAGLPTATILWPGAARSANRYVIPEIKRTRPGQSLPWLIASGGRPLFMLHMGLRYRSLLKSLQYVHLDNFSSAVAAHLIQRRRTNLLLLHLLDLDGTRHRHGFRAPQVDRVLVEQGHRLGMLLSAARRSGDFDNTTFIVFGDHAYIDVHTRVRLNSAFRRAGLLEIDGRGRLRSWQAWANCCDGSAQIRLKNPSDRAVHAALAEIFDNLQHGAQAVVERVYTEAEIREMMVDDQVDYMLEAKAGCYFVAEIQGEVVGAGGGHFRATHGYHPQRQGYSSLLLAAGAGIRPGVELGTVGIMDLGPTIATLLGLAMPDTDGRPLTEILDCEYKLRQVLQ
jgi:predicted AlkP superfamily pyrophosphatase or phosphodiesterase